MKIAFDVDVIEDLGITRMVHQVARGLLLGYDEQSLHPQINPFYKRAAEIAAEHKQAARYRP